MADEREMEQEKQRSNSLRQARLKVLFSVGRRRISHWSFNLLLHCTYMYSALGGRHSGFIVGTLDSRSSSMGLSSSQGHVLCSWARHFTLTVPLSIQMY